MAHTMALNYYVERNDYDGDSYGASDSSETSQELHSQSQTPPPISISPLRHHGYQRQSKKFRCTWKGCHFVEHTQAKIEVHIRNKHLGKKARRSGDCDSCSENEHEEEFYYTEDDDDDELVKTTPSLAPEPTLSHRDMARPPTEDPEYQNQIVGNFKQGRGMHSGNHHLSHNQHLPLHHNNSNNNSNSRGSPHINSSHQQQLHNNNTSCIPTSPLAHRTYPWSSPSSTQFTVSSSSTLNKHSRQSSTRPSHSVAPYPPQTYVQHHNHHNYAGSGNSSSSISGSNSSSPIIHSNSSANNMLQQLSQQNVTVTAHHSQQQNSSNNSHHHQQQQQQQHNHHQQQQQQQHHLSSVTITANYHPTQQQSHHNQQQHQHQHQVRGQQQTTTASNMVANTNTNTNTNNSNSNSNSNANANANMPLQHVAVQQAVAKHTPNSPNRRTRGENKKCRKVYGMERREQWCTQCRWKKACSRFGD